MHCVFLQYRGFIYRTRAIITRGLYIFYPLFEGQKCFLRGFFHKILALCMVSNQERVIMARVRYLLFLNLKDRLFEILMLLDYLV